MSLFTLGVALLGAAVGLLIGGISGFLAGHDAGEKDAREQIAARLKRMQREAWKS